MSASQAIVTPLPTGAVIPAGTLRAEMEDGTHLDGETSIAHSTLKIKRVTLCPADAKPLDEVLQAIALAE